MVDLKDIPKRAGSEYGDHRSDGSCYETTSSSQDDSLDPIAAEENRQVWLSKLFLIGILLLAAGGVAYGTWKFTTDAEQEDFHSSFEGFANEIIKVSQINANAEFQALKSLALSVTSFGMASPGSWPFVTMGQAFYNEGQYTLGQMSATWIVQTPLIIEDNRAKWEEYAWDEQGWRLDLWEAINQQGPKPTNISECIFRLNYTDWSTACDDGVFDEGLPFYAPVWGVAVPIHNGVPDGFTNNNAWADPIIPPIAREMFRTGEGVLSEAFGASLYGEEYAGDVLPDSYLVQPIYEDFSPDAEIVSFLTAAMTWTFFGDIISDDKSDGIILTLENLCAPSFSFRIDGPDVTFLGQGDHHDPKYDDFEIAVNATDIRAPEDCRYVMHLFPSEDFEAQYKTNRPMVFTVGAILIFVVTAMSFVLYDCLVQKRQKKVMTTANRTGALVNSLFPRNVRDRLMLDESMDNPQNNKMMFGFPMTGSSNRLGADGDSQEDKNGSPIVFHTKPIADYYPEGSLMVADLVGFTAWSSEREPAQVFTLLETLYNSFDRIAKKRRIFKVETFGDCYVASAGVPDPMNDHALHICRFALDCKYEMRKVVRQMEVWLGPDTGDLSMKIGIHSGPVTGGVLRGEKSRFQLFGETMDDAFRMEDTALPGRVHVSQATADLLKAGGKFHWLTPSEKKIVLKGKTETKSYWLKISPRESAKKVERVPTTDEECSMEDPSTSSLDAGRLEAIENSNSADKKQRLVDWNVDNLMRLLKMIVAMRGDGAKVQRSHVEPSENPLSEVKEIITLRSEMNAFKCDPSTVQLPPLVESQLADYVSVIASLYRENHFHNFEHACHVTQAITKLLSRVVTSETIDTTTMTYKQKGAASDLHDFSFGLTSDPIIQFACAISALIHDADHPGVPNSQLVKEKTDTAALYKNQSVAEQNSVDLAWNLLMEDRYKDLRNCIYTNQTELERFRQLVVNSVMATDIVDKELGALRKGRWNKAFSSEDGDEEESEKDQIDRKATIVIEHLIQAADVSHMMQHWNIYKKWNEKFFRECYQGYLLGRAEKDPSLNWYEGEKGFFDFYIIPLAKKLATCGVFGVSSDEFLNYAIANRKEWEVKGQDVVKEYVENFRATAEEL